MNSTTIVEAFWPGALSANPSTSVVIVAGGSGDRFLNPNGKQLHRILGKPVLTWSAEAFDAVAEVGQIIIVAPEDRIEEYVYEAIDGYSFVTPIVMAPSGAIRQESSFSGLSAVGDEFEFIAIHDGARPLVTPDLIDKMLTVIRGDLEVDGAVVGYPAIDTLKLVNDRVILGTPDRTLLWVAQTPQIFRAPVIREAHVAALSEGFVGTDDSSLVERLGGKMVLVQGPRDNIKITVPEDRLSIEAALLERAHELDRLA
ncbi:MAG: 2-C-methyl-D-erythritol 4-phosphate cytidylyltransferase [Coriobacteriia bacterium]|nr:2-C-methyl-D-erythritol 4-phosphate cytidylyltransferase [Coriobacteriia bacterium]